MKKPRLRLTSILGSAMLVLLVSCVGYTPTDSTVGNISVKQARKDLAAALKASRRIGVESSVTAEQLVVSFRGESYSYRFSEIPKDLHLNGSYPGCDYCRVIVLSGKSTFAIDDAYAVAFVNALYVLKNNALNQKAKVDEADASFTASLADYQKKIAANYAIPEEANRYKVQAESAVRDREFDDAADLYAKALEIAPWWAKGHFNRALILVEIGEFATAIKELKRYLLLVPDAPDARAVQDRIYELERKIQS